MSTLNDIKKYADKLYPGRQNELPYLLCAWIRVNPGDEVGCILRKAGSNINTVGRAYEKLLDGRLLKEESRLLEACILKYDLKEMTGFHLLLAVCNAPESRLYAALTAAQVIMGKLIDILEKHVKELRANRTGKFSDQNSLSKVDTSLTNFGRDLTALASKGEFDGLAERNEEINSIINILLKKNKRNVVLTGPAGVGKTGIVQLLARRIALHEIPGFNDHCVYEISIGRIVAGSKYRGDFEQRIYGILEAVNKHGKIILFVDEFHLLIGAGSAEGVNTDASNLLKPYLTGNTLQVIGATTHEEYESFVKADLALERRFQEIRIKRPDGLVTRLMLLKQADSLEAYHGVSVPDELKSLVVELTERYIFRRNSIDNSMDLLDTALAHAKRNGETELTREILYNTISLMAGRKIIPPESSPGKSWLSEFRKELFSETADIFILGSNFSEVSLEIARNYLRRINLLLSQKGIELIFDEDRILRNLISKVEENNRKSTSIFYLLETLMLKPLAEKILDRNGVENPGRYILEDDFYIKGKIKQVEAIASENRTTEKILI